MKQTKLFVFVFIIVALGVPYNVSAQTAGEPFREEGIASWYGSEFDGRLTASGEIFDSSLLTAAHPTLPFGSMVLVTNRINNRQVVVRVNDRGPFVPARIIDLSMAAAQVLRMLDPGVVPVNIEVLHPGVVSLPPAPQPPVPQPPVPQPPVHQPPVVPQPPAPQPPPIAAAPEPQPVTVIIQHPPWPEMMLQQIAPQPAPEPQPHPPITVIIQNPPWPEMMQPQVIAETPAPEPQPHPPITVIIQNPAPVEPPAATVPQPLQRTELPPAVEAPLPPVVTIPHPAWAELPPVVEPPPPIVTIPHPAWAELPPAVLPPPVVEPPPPVVTIPHPAWAELPPAGLPPAGLPPPVTAFLPPSGAILHPPITPIPGRTYTLQVGTFRQAQNAVGAFSRLREAGLSPSYERVGDMFRVVLSGIQGSDVQSVADRIGAAGFNEAMIREE